MLPQDAAVVEAPLMFPYQCAICTNQKGQTLDTMIDKPELGPGTAARIYICRSCARDTAKLFGWVKGDRADELNRASDVLVQTEKDMIALQDRVQGLAAEVNERNGQIDVLNAELERLRGVAEQLRFKAAQVRDSANELVAGAV